MDRGSGSTPCNNNDDVNVDVDVGVDGNDNDDNGWGSKDVRTWARMSGDKEEEGGSDHLMCLRTLFPKVG